jgi:metallo-beta-lactamase family protein
MPAPAPTVQFLGAAGTVTGSAHLVRAQGRTVLLDCGLFQGLKELRLRNWRDFPIDPAAIDAVVLSHAHVDHTGRLPLLVRQGFRGPVYCTAATRGLVEIMLPDAAHLQEEEAERANRRGYSRHHPALPLYTVGDADAVISLLAPRPYGTTFPVVPGIHARFRRVGHILGAASIEIEIGGGSPVRVAFSGDLGRFDRPILRDPEPVPAADVLLCESTYGDRAHAPAADAEEALARIVRDGAARGGAILVPAFALGRTQELLWLLHELEDAKRIPSLPVYVDSPLAIEVTGLYGRHPEDHDAEMQERVRLNGSDWQGKRVRLVHRPEESKALNRVRGPVIIISASGMATGGRILHHLSQRLPDPRTTVLLVGFQAAGTRGLALKERATALRMFGQQVPVRAVVECIDALSAHAGQDEILRWLDGFERPPRATYLVHGEPPAAETLERLVRARGWTVRAARDGETVPLTAEP